MPHIYCFDTSALIHRYLDGPSSRQIRRIVSDRRNKCYLPELCVVEMSSALGRRLRGNHLGHREFDRLETQFFADIANGLLEVHPLRMQDFTRARALLRYAGMVKKRRLTSFDSLVACASLDLAYKEKQKVTLCTSDKPLFSILSDIGAYTAALELRFFAVPAQTHASESPIPIS
jgi:hypothetical protein